MFRMVNLRNFKPRSYQQAIFETAKKLNTLVVLPTGLGKTAISMLLAVERLNRFPDSKVLLCSPTKPLCNQHFETFQKYTDINQEEISLLTGMINPTSRIDLWHKSRIVIATPQTVQSDIENNRINLRDFSLLVIDEAHKSRLYYANTIVAKHYLSNAENALLLGLTASPGGTKEKIEEICKNLGIESVEIRTEQDLDVKTYLQEKQLNWIKVELPEKFLKVRDELKKLYKEKVKNLKKLGVSKPVNLISKKDLLNLQVELRKRILKRDVIAFYGISLTAQLLKLDYCIELLETQGLDIVKNYLDKLKIEDTKASKSLMKDKKFQKSIKDIDLLHKQNLQHPKINELRKIILNQLSKTKASKTIVFANFRNTVENIVNELNKIPEINAAKLIGQKEGLSQKKQIETIKKFEQGKYNTLVGTSITEEGLDILGCDTAIFYDAVASEIRKIQRAGRIGRLEKGRIFFLITKNTRDEAYYWSSIRKEKMMKHTLYKMQSEEQAKLS